MKYNHNWSNKFQESFNWHRWFAWYPVSDGNSIVLGEWVWRRRRESMFDVYWVYSFADTPPVTPES